MTVECAECRGCRSWGSSHRSSIHASSRQEWQEFCSSASQARIPSNGICWLPNTAHQRLTWPAHSTPDCQSRNVEQQLPLAQLSRQPRKQLPRSCWPRKNAKHSCSSSCCCLPTPSQRASEWGEVKGEPYKERGNNTAGIARWIRMACYK